MNNKFEKAKSGLKLSKNFEAGTVKNPLFKLFAKCFPMAGEAALDAISLAFNKYQESKISCLIDYINNSGVLITSDMVEGIGVICDFRSLFKDKRE